MTPDSAQPSRAAERAAQRGSQSNPENVPDEVRYSVEELMEGARHLLRVPAPAVAGALSGESRKTFTLDEAKTLVDEFLGREVE